MVKPKKKVECITGVQLDCAERRIKREVKADIKKEFNKNLWNVYKVISGIGCWFGGIGFFIYVVSTGYLINPDSSSIDVFFIVMGMVLVWGGAFLGGVFCLARIEE